METLNVTTEKPVLFDTENSKNWLRTLLREQNVSVTFQKLDGSERTMLCTLSEVKIPVENRPKGTSTVKNDQSLAVFDVEKQGWRSFRWDSIKSIQFDLGAE
jgi:hypothetical protein